MAAMKEWRSATVLADDLVGHLVNRFIESSRFDCSIKEMNGWTGELNHSHFSSWTLKNFPQWAAIFSVPHQICRSPGDEMLRPTIKNTIQHTSSPLWKEKKMKRCTGEKRAAVTVIPLLASTRKKKEKWTTHFIADLFRLEINVYRTVYVFFTRPMSSAGVFQRYMHFRDTIQHTRKTSQNSTHASDFSFFFLTSCRWTVFWR